MRIKELKLKNYDVIREANFMDLSDFVVIAGPNGVGKTKVKNAICHIFANSGNPPANSSVVLEATNDDEKSNWQAQQVTLPHQGFWNLFSRSRKKIKTKSRLIQMESNRQIDSIAFNPLTFDQIGRPEEDEVGTSYSSQLVKDRFKDVCDTLRRLKGKLITSYGSDTDTKFRENPDSSNINLSRQEDPTKKFETLFKHLLHPKEMVPISVDDRTINYKDSEGNVREISALSSGEREAVVLAFSLLLEEPSDSIIVIDEPELHLHPELTFRLLQVLKAIGERNQFFLFTHSTDIIGSSFETGIYFIRPKNTVPEGDQVTKINLENIGELSSIPNLREAIGMLSLGKKLLFVEGNAESIDRNVFSTIAKSIKTDLAIVPSESCNNINNLSLLAESLQRGIFGIELFMVRDRDSLSDEEIDNFRTKSGNRMIFLPYYCIENFFLDPEAIFKIAQKYGITKANSVETIKDKLVELALANVNTCVVKYVKSEIRFRTGNFDVSPDYPVTTSANALEITSAITESRDRKIGEISGISTDQVITERVTYWKDKLSNAISAGWTNDAQALFYGKSILNQMQNWLFGSKKIFLWEEITFDESEECKNAIKPLREIIENI